MPRHPGIQHQMRMEELAKKLANAGGLVQESFREMRNLEEKAAQLKITIAQAEKKLAELLVLQDRLIQCQTLPEFGLPPDITSMDFKRITGHEITS